MSSEPFTQPGAGANEPKRQRGRIRVAAILEAGAEIFLEKGYEAATMTEIAARSDTAIGSLYRFFPSKEALADTLLLRYAKLAVDGLAEVEQRAAAMPPEALAAALVDFMLALKAERSFAIALLDAGAGSDDKRAQFRAAMRHGVMAIVKKAAPNLPAARAEAMAAVLLHLLKGVLGARGADQDKPALRRAVANETRELVRMYLASARALPAA
ncbi:TetR/AcrR family transcriptional regulator [Cupriavidus sp. 30B13]|uniref:TetR/AcrR family transcriptional regulator n=1 Tax=Cupriavidus sp. 30B13 TaxID=3384241 RepID=UPI003B980016